jgi:uncharacterized protein (TIGR03435 family)
MMHNTRVFSMIFYAYKLSGRYEIDGYDRHAPASDWYDLDARAGAGATDDQIRQMMQSLLADRFKLRLHRETREIPQYELVIGRGGPKLTPAGKDDEITVRIEDRTFKQRAGACDINLWKDGEHLVCHSATMETLTNQLRNAFQSPVVDRTKLTGVYDIHIRYFPENRRLDPDAEPGPSLAQALEEELGIRAQRERAPRSTRDRSFRETLRKLISIVVPHDKLSDHVPNRASDQNIRRVMPLRGDTR